LRDHTVKAEDAKKIAGREWRRRAFSANRFVLDFASGKARSLARFFPLG